MTGEDACPTTPHGSHLIPQFGNAGHDFIVGAFVAVAASIREIFFPVISGFVTENDDTRGDDERGTWAIMNSMSSRDRVRCGLRD